MIVVEGPDGAGKTTLCRKLCQDFDLAMGERGLKNRDLLYKVTRPDTWRAVHDELRADRPPYVWDRLGPFSDPIYAKYAIPPRQCAFALSEIAMFKQFIRTFQIPVIICLPDKATVLDNAVSSHQMGGVHTNIERIYEEYSHLPKSLYIPVTKHDYTDAHSYDRVHTRIRQFLGYRRERELLA